VSSYQHSHSEDCQRKIASQHFEQNCTRIKALYCCYPLEHGSRRKYEGRSEYEHRINGVSANHVCANQPHRAYVLHILKAMPTSDVHPLRSGAPEGHQIHALDSRLADRGKYRRVVHPEREQIGAALIRFPYLLDCAHD
jgi:hypothetical protein